MAKGTDGEKSDFTTFSVQSKFRFIDRVCKLHKVVCFITSIELWFNAVKTLVMKVIVSYFYEKNGRRIRISSSICFLACFFCHKMIRTPRVVFKACQEGLTHFQGHSFHLSRVLTRIQLALVILGLDIRSFDYSRNRKQVNYKGISW